MWTRFVVSELLLLSVGAAAAERRQPDPVEILTHYLSHGIGQSPFDSDLVRDRINATLLLAACDGVTIGDLSRIVPNDAELEKRLAALEKSKLLQRTSGRVATSFPILLGEKRERYGVLVRKSAEEIYPKFYPAIRALSAKLQADGWGDWAYHFVWSQIFDSQFLWAEMVDRQLVPPLQPVLVWVIYPEHPFKTGTNIYPDDDLKDPVMAVTWTAHGANTIGWVGGQWRTVYTSALAGRPPDEAATRTLTQLGLLETGGHLAIPVVRRDDPLHVQLRETGARYLVLLEAKWPAEEVAGLLGVDRRVARAISYHDISWELLRLLTERAGLKAPVALASKEGDGGTPSMRGVCSVVPADPRFTTMVAQALGMRAPETSPH